MLMVQFEPAATLVPQVLDWLKSLAFAPAMEMPVIVSAEPPVLDSVTSCALLVVFTTWLANAIEAGEGVTAGALTPEPDSATV